MNDLDYGYRSFPLNKNIETVQIHNNGKANTVALNEVNIYIPEDFELIMDKAKSELVMDNCEPYIKGLRDNGAFDAMILVCERQFGNRGSLEYYGIHSAFFHIWMFIRYLKNISFMIVLI